MSDRYVHVIEVSSDGEIWQPSFTSNEAEEHAEGAEDYGREVMAQWTVDEYPEGISTDEYDNPLVRVVVYPADAEVLQQECAAATVYAEA